MTPLRLNQQPPTVGREGASTRTQPLWKNVQVFPKTLTLRPLKLSLISIMFVRSFTNRINDSSTLLLVLKLTCNPQRGGTAVVTG